MNIIEMKQELAKRYLYLYENAAFILAPYVNESTITLTTISNTTLHQIEEFLLGDKNMEKMTLYRYIENKKQDKSYLEQVKKILELIDEKNKPYANSHNIFKYKLDIMKILIAVRRHIEDQSQDLKNKKRKLQVLEQYFKITQYHNIDPEILYKRTENLEIKSNRNNHNNNPHRKKNDTGTLYNNFIATFSGTYAISLTEEEIQQIYLTVHDELPWNLETTCLSDETEYIKKPKITTPCHKKFYIKEEEIFIHEKNYYQLCPHCGYIVNIPSRLLSEGIKTRIKNHCIEDPYLSRKMILYSELKKLDKISSSKTKKLIKE